MPGPLHTQQQGTSVCVEVGGEQVAVVVGLGRLSWASPKTALIVTRIPNRAVRTDSRTTTPSRPSHWPTAMITPARTRAVSPPHTARHKTGHDSHEQQQGREPDQQRHERGGQPRHQRS